MRKFKQYLPWVLVGVFALWIAATLRPRNTSAFDTRAFGQLPVLLNGRVQPMDSVARNSLLQMRNKQTVLLENRKSLPATDFLMDMLMKPDQADTRKVFRIDHPEVLSLLKLSAEEKHFSFAELKPSLQEIDRQAQRIGRIDDKQRNALEKQIMKLHNAMMLYHRLKNSLKPEEVKDFPATLAAYSTNIASGVEAMQAQHAGKEHDKEALARIMPVLRGFEFVSRAAYPLLVPPLDRQHAPDAWENVGTSLLSLASGAAAKVHPAISHYAAMSAAYSGNRPAEFNQAVSAYRQWLSEKGFTSELAKGRWEYFYNHLQAFYKSTAIYVVAFLLACISWVNNSEWSRRSGYYLTLFAFLVHTFGLVFRMVLEARPPVTNLYSSAVFVGWGAVLLGLILERIYRDGIGTVTAAAVGFTTQIIAHNLAIGGDTMEMMRAVLDSNFWLTTHVITITIGYSSCFVAGFLAIIYIIRGVFTKSLSQETAKSLHRMVYGIICFATLFSFVGTVLGGIWADQSWGRFWGWDPKENGALLIVLWTAAYLHVRWGGLMGPRGLMNMAVFGNVITAFSWFGVNMLGVGLHSYGFMESGFIWLMAFIVSQLAIIGLGMLPLHMWRSFSQRTPVPPSGYPMPAAATGK